MEGSEKGTKEGSAENRDEKGNRGETEHKKIKLRGALGQSLEKFTHNRSLGRV